MLVLHIIVIMQAHYCLLIIVDSASMLTEEQSPVAKCIVTFTIVCHCLVLYGRCDNTIAPASADAGLYLETAHASFEETALAVLLCRSGQCGFTL